VKTRELPEVVFNENVFKTLVIDKEYKKVMTAMVKSYLSKEPTFTGFIRGKGRGLVVLLHGSPGTGKIFTASRHCFKHEFYKG
jgi:AAA+ superfamily predicted ATPase